jgi:hypothetical protein
MQKPSEKVLPGLKEGGAWDASSALVLDLGPVELRDRALASVLKIMYPNHLGRNVISTRKHKLAQPSANTEHTAWRYRYDSHYPHVLLVSVLGCCTCRRASSWLCPSGAPVQIVGCVCGGGGGGPVDILCAWVGCVCRCVHGGRGVSRIKSCKVICSVPLS